MGFFRTVFPKKIKDPVTGTARIVGCSGHGVARAQDIELQLVVQVEGWEPYATEHAQMCPVEKWPHPGQIVPVTVSKSDPHHLRVEFGELPGGRDDAWQQAQQLAESMQGGADAAPGAAGGVPGVHVVDLSKNPEAAADAIARAEQATGMDLNADGVIGTGSAAPRAEDDVDQTERIEQLERFAGLRRSGALTEAEFEAEKAKLLGT